MVLKNSPANTGGEKSEIVCTVQGDMDTERHKLTTASHFRPYSCIWFSVSSFKGFWPASLSRLFTPRGPSSSSFLKSADGDAIPIMPSFRITTCLSLGVHSLRTDFKIATNAS